MSEDHHMSFAKQDIYNQRAGALTLSELNAAIKTTVEAAFPETVWIIAEIAEIRCNARGHCYLELVEREGEKTRAQMRANIWAYTFRSIALTFERTTGESLRQGMKVLLQVSVTYHEVYGLSLNIRDIDPAYSLGEMARRKREIIDRLAKEGLLQLNKQIDLPLIAQRIAVISSSSAAGYGDFTNHLDNNPFQYKILHELYQSSLQGEEAVAAIIAALQKIARERARYDAVVIIRGGGSQLDLSCFDTYELAAKVAQFPLPVVTGIGHERDDTVVDIVAHTKLKTPTAVAEFFLSAMRGFEERLDNAWKTLSNLARELCQRDSQRLRDLMHHFRHNVKEKFSGENAAIDAMLLKLAHRAAQSMNHQRNRLETDRGRFIAGLDVFFQRQHDAIHHFEESVRFLDPVNVLKRGYSITYFHGKALSDGSVLEPGDLIETKFFTGLIRSRVEDSHVSE